MHERKFLILFALLIAICYIPLIFIGVSVQDECHFFDPVYEIFDSGRWASPYMYYLGGGIEKLAYGHPPTGGLVHAFWFKILGDGHLAVRISAMVSKLFGVIVLWYILGKMNANKWLSFIFIFIFCFHNYAVFNVVRPDFFAGTFLLLYTWSFYKKKYWLAIVFWALSISFHQIMAIPGTAFYFTFIFIEWKNHLSFKKLNFKQILVAPLAAMLFLIIWFLPLVIFNGPSAIEDAVKGLIHHLSIVDRSVQWYTDSIFKLIKNQLPYYLVIVCSLFILKKSDKYVTGLIVALLCSWLYVMVKTVNTSWYYYMFSPLYVMVGVQIWQRVFNLENLKLKQGLGLISLILLLFIVKTRHLNLLIKQPLLTIFNGNTQNSFLGEKVINFPSNSRVLSTPQLYHHVRTRFKESFDAEYYGVYGPAKDLLNIDYLFLMEEIRGKGSDQRLSLDQKKILYSEFELIYDSHEDPISDIYNYKYQKEKIKRFQIFQNKESSNLD